MHKILYTSSKVIVAKIQRDCKFTDTSYVADALVWLGEAIAHIGAYNSRQPMYLEKKVIDYKVAIPCNLDNFLGITNNGLVLTLNPRITRKAELNTLQGVPHSNRYYNYDDQVFTFNFTDETVEIHCLGIPMDCEFPKIPDNASYKEACQFYIINRMIMSGFIHPLKEFTFDYTWNKFEHFAQRARNEVDELKITDMNQFIEEWNSPFLGTDLSTRAFGARTQGSYIPGEFDSDNPFAIKH